MCEYVLIILCSIDITFIVQHVYNKFNLIHLMGNSFHIVHSFHIVLSVSVFFTFKIVYCIRSWSGTISINTRHIIRSA